MGCKHAQNHFHAHDGKLSFAVFINILLTVVQIIGGLVSGSLSLIMKFCDKSFDFSID